MKKRIFKRIISIATIAGIACNSLAIIPNLTANASTITRSTDNDPVATGYSYDVNNMTYYNGMTGSYNGDMRLSPSINDDSAYYMWIYPIISFIDSSCYVSLNVYLNHASFTDKAASYDFEVLPVEGSAGIGRSIGTINQKYAPAGWSSISKNINCYPDPSGPHIISRNVSVHASSGSYKQLGADGLQVTVTY